MLTCLVSRPARENNVGSHAAQVDNDLVSVTFQQQRERCTDDMVGSLEIYAPRHPPVYGIAVRYRAGQRSVPGIVDDNVQSPKGFLRFLDPSDNLIIIRYVNGHRDDIERGGQGVARQGRQP